MPVPFGAVVPVKPPRVAKSRLAPLGDRARAALAEAFAVDTVTALLACREVESVVVVTDDEGVADTFAALGAEPVPDGGGGDLNRSLARGVAELARHHPRLRPVVVCADLPALRPSEVGRALAAMPAGRMALVADAAGVGTTLLAGSAAGALDPSFGAGSRAAHLARGAVEVGLADIPTVRRDVDTPDDLADAVSLGVRARTALVLAALRGPGPGTSAPATTVGPVQATVASYEQETRSGTVVLDDGHELPFAAPALRGSGLRLLRPGQRVRLETRLTDTGPVVERLQIVTLA